MAKELGRFLMNDGRVHILSIDSLDNGDIVTKSVHLWPDGHKSECEIAWGSRMEPEKTLNQFIAQQIDEGIYIATAY